ncbi:MAG: tetratricopeptide repeat protein [Acidobacteria bacterium]|nr:tetratricopeptide repeat protein [Acidobacteriota bacterium]
MRRVLALVLGATCLLAACARSVPLPVVAAPKFPDYIRPSLPSGGSGGRAEVASDRAWQFLQAGDLRNASREVEAALDASPAFYPASATLGYVDLAAGEAAAALQTFDRVLTQAAGYAPALAGRGEALLALHRGAEAMAAFEAAVAADPSLVDLRRRIDVLKFRTLQERLAAARRAAQEGRTAEAIAAYTDALASSPDSPYLYRELGIVERQRGDLDAALEHLRRAVELDPADAGSLEQIGDLLAGRNDLAGAESAYASASRIDPSPALARKIDAIRARADLARLPAEYRAIGAASQLTRADLAALIGVRLAPLLEAHGRGAVVITDVRLSWALPWIMAVARAGVMAPFDNHAFQPTAIVRRADLAQAVARLLSRIGERRPDAAAGWESARRSFTDLSPGHLAYPSASAAVASGVMTTDPAGAFQPFRPVAGAEAIEVIGRLETLAGQPAAGRTSP